MATAKKRFYRIVSAIEGFRRAGIAHSRTATDHPVESISDKQFAQLENEPKLIVTEIEKDVGTEDESDTKQPAKKVTGL